jgi:hypothetical protein
VFTAWVENAATGIELLAVTIIVGVIVLQPRLLISDH